MAELMITLPDRNEMAYRLLSVSGVGDIVKRMYPHILERAGATVEADGVPMLVALATAEYTEATNAGPALGAVMATMQHEYVRALIDDPAALEKALDVLERAGLPTGRGKQE